MYFPQFWRLGSPKSRYQPMQFLGRILLLVCKKPLPSCCALTWWKEGEEMKRERERERERRRRRRRESLVPLFIRISILWDQGPTLMTSFNLNYVLTALIPNTVTLGVKASTYEWVREDKHPAHGNMYICKCACIIYTWKQAWRIYIYNIHQNVNNTYV